MKVFNLLNHKNQYMVYHDDAIYFQSYGTLMATIRYSFNGGYSETLEINSRYWSVTTGRHMKAFLEETRMLDNVLCLIREHRVFKSLKDFMQRATSVTLFMGEIDLEYKNNKGETETFICKAP